MSCEALPVDVVVVGDEEALLCSAKHTRSHGAILPVCAAPSVPCNILFVPLSTGEGADVPSVLSRRRKIMGITVEISNMGPKESEIEV